MSAPVHLYLGLGVLLAWAGPAEKAARATNKDGEQAEYARFKGTWKYVSMEMNGKPVTEPGLPKARLICAGDQFKMVAGGLTMRGTFKLDTSKTPRHIDVTFTDGPEKGKTAHGIYELKGDTYRVCMALVGKDRPTAFRIKPGSGHVLQVLHLVPTGGEDDRAALERRRLAGTWQAVSYALDGKAAAADDLKNVQLVIDAEGRARAQSEGKTFLASTITMDPTKRPRTMDIRFTKGDDKGKTALGIYKIKGDRLTICRSAPGQPRPTQFSSTPGSGLTLMVYRRVKSR